MKKKEDTRDILIVEKQQCPVCGKNNSTISEYEIEEPFQGTISIFAIKCNSCGFKNSDLEFLEPKAPAEYILKIKSKEDLDIRVIKSGDCEIKIPNFRISVDSSMNSEGFISNVEGVILRFKKQIQFLKSNDEMDKTKRKKLKNLLKGIDEVLDGEKEITIKLIDKSGNSSIISDKVEIKKLKV